mmetsp:Transcript_22588/g.53599  ORF Transcript_22588/g.53599 Transcript_22588/m.53599 type:complete len:90 (-) Transcript_22588:610-879(-)
MEDDGGADWYVRPPPCAIFIVQIGFNFRARMLRLYKFSLDLGYIAAVHAIYPLKKERSPFIAIIRSNGLLHQQQAFFLTLRMPQSLPGI